MDNKSERSGRETVAREGLVVRSGVTRPRVGSSIRQLAVAVLDTSASMEGGKLYELNAAMVGLHSELAKDENRDAFSLGIVVYGTTAIVHLAPTSAKQIDPSKLAVVCGVAGGTTSMSTGLIEAERLITQEGGERSGWARPLVVDMSDGHANSGDNPVTVATRLKKVADIVTVAFGADADTAMLERLATSPQNAVRCANGAELKKFFATVGATMSAAARTGTNAAALLGAGGILRG